MARQSYGVGETCPAVPQPVRWHIQMVTSFLAVVVLFKISSL